ncbi:TMEM175 family protein [Streptomyces sp. IBSBF 2435]|uniref:TMEM175 family protein n=1 Tax=Streptomyces sp. IBSBF 2435 TaxID=2903531 RepID=UPI002FDC3E70
MPTAVRAAPGELGCTRRGTRWSTGPLSAGNPNGRLPAAHAVREIHLENETAIEARASDRLIHFSDAVVAIAITLLALELPVPAGRDVSAFWKSLLSLVAISASPGGRHRIFRAAERIGTLLRMINMFWLMMIILNPLATKMLTTEDHDSLSPHALRYGFYALLQTPAAVALVVIARRLAARHLLVGGDRPIFRGQGGGAVRHHPRLRAAHPGLLLRHVRLGTVDRRTGAGQADPAAAARAAARVPGRLASRTLWRPDLLGALVATGLRCAFP